MDVTLCNKDNTIKCAILASFSLFSSCQQLTCSVNIKLCLCLDLNRGPLVWEASTLVLAHRSQA